MAQFSMTPREHLHEAERLASKADYGAYEDTAAIQLIRMARALEAQAHCAIAQTMGGVELAVADFHAPQDPRLPRR